MKLLISAGGKGIRLGNLTKNLPKPMINVNGKPILHHLVDWAKKNEFEEIIMMNGFMAEKIVDYFKDGKQFGIKITHSNEDYPLDTGGAIKLAGQYVDSTFVYVNGDTIYDVDLKKMMQFHKNKNSDMTIFLHKSSHPLDSDILEVDKDNKIINFFSKHDKNKKGNLSNCGLCIIEPKILKLMDKEVFNFENYLYPKLINSNFNVLGYISEEPITELGTLERLKKYEGAK
ncbi:nucleotidyltransferase family protein [Candidatus Woesearchaeota archaeon]|nr:nucleotidyltransferase family protein [Candidatus Woesearchaeota archaeon]